MLGVSILRLIVMQNKLINLLLRSDTSLFTLVRYEIIFLNNALR